MPPTLTPRDRRLPITPVVFVSARDARGSAFMERTHAVNASGTGLCFDSAHDLAIGSRIRLKVLVPPAWRARFGSRRLYPLRAVVRRSVRGSGDGRFRVAVSLLGEDVST
jgi:hypothetical protein